MKQKVCLVLSLMLPILTVGVFLLGTAPTASAAGSCDWEGRSYSEGACKANDCISPGGQYCNGDGKWLDCGSCKLGGSDPDGIASRR